MSARSGRSSMTALGRPSVLAFDGNHEFCRSTAAATVWGSVGETKAEAGEETSQERAR
jgi:hypothetical protein